MATSWCTLQSHMHSSECTSIAKDQNHAQAIY